MILCMGDHEYPTFDSIEEHAGFSPGPDCELHHADLVVSLEGYRGHYLGRDFIYEAMELLEPDSTTSVDRDILDRYEDEYDVEFEPSYTIGEAVSEMVGEYEARLSDAGFYVIWNDGVQVVKVGEEIEGGPKEEPVNVVDLSTTPEFAIEEARRRAQENTRDHKNPPYGNLDIYSNGSLVLCACELSTAVYAFGDRNDLEDWEPGKDENQDAFAKEVLEAAFNIQHQIISVNREGRG